MRATEVRRYIRNDHERLRAMLFSIRTLGRHVIDGDHSRIRTLRLEGETLHEQLLVHMHWEDKHLAPTLRQVASWGSERAERLDREHREQRELLSHTLAGLRDASRPPLVLARNMVDLVGLLLEDMNDEENLLRDERVRWDEIEIVDTSPS